MSKFNAFLNRMLNFIRTDIWRITEKELSQTRRIIYRFIKTLILAVRGFYEEDLIVKASALTFSIVFAIVPLFALITAIAKGFGVEKMIRDSLESILIGQEDLIPAIMGFVERYLQSTQGGLFIGIGLAVLIYSVMNFFMQVESAFNGIWQVKKSRSLIRQFTTYFSSILIIPILIVLSSGLSIFINTAVAQSFLYDVLSPVLRFGVKFAPFFINWLVFTAMYLLIPNTRVRFFNASVAGIVAGTAYQIFQLLYIHGQVYLSRYNVVYGSFAAVPLLLLWLQISCLIVLLGAEISYASQNIQNFEYELDTKNMSTRYKNFLTLFIAYIVIKQFEKQKPPLSSTQIADNYNLPIGIVNQILTKLVEVSILVEVFNDYSKTKIYQPAIDINQLTVNLLFNKLDSHGSELFLSNKNELLDAFWQKTLDIKLRNEENTTQLLIKDI
ncbi:MAG: YihY/virulence factor BrkB family protein [Bacteroidota bacterium]|nr:YihY/virulence factor BrkB family protein [Bacteroidota bacterium]